MSELRFWSDKFPYLRRPLDCLQFLVVPKLNAPLTLPSGHLKNLDLELPLKPPEVVKLEKEMNILASRLVRDRVLQVLIPNSRGSLAIRSLVLRRDASLQTWPMMD